MKQAELPQFDFDQWAELAREDPAVFEQLRQLTLDLAILKRSRRNRERLQGLQWRIDRLREQSRTPMAACVHLSNMMWDTFEKLNESYRNPELACKTDLPKAPPLQLYQPDQD